MLDAVGAPSLDALIDEVVPSRIRSHAPLDIPGPDTKSTCLRRLAELAARNRVLRSYLGLGYHDTITPSVILRMVMENPGWYTPYTPYQAEIAQGRLESLINFQTMVVGPHRDGDRQRLAARRGHGRRRSDGAAAPRAAGDAGRRRRRHGPPPVPRVRRRLRADDRRAARAGGAARTSRSWWRRSTAWRSTPRRSASCCSTRTTAAGWWTCARTSSARRRPAWAWPWPRTCWP